MLLTKKIAPNTDFYVGELYYAFRTEDEVLEPHLYQELLVFHS